MSLGTLKLKLTNISLKPATKLFSRIRVSVANNESFINIINEEVCLPLNQENSLLSVKFEVFDNDNNLFNQGVFTFDCKHHPHCLEFVQLEKGGTLLGEFNYIPTIHDFKNKGHPSTTEQQQEIPKNA